LNGILRALNSEASSLQRRLVDALVEENKSNTNVSLDHLIRALANKRDMLSRLTDVQRLKQEDGARILAAELNEAYASISVDLYSLYGAGNQISDILYRYERVSEERNNRLESSIRTEEGRIGGLQFLKDRPWNLEAFDQDLSQNFTTSDRAAVYNSEDKSLSLTAMSSEEIQRNATVSVRIIGNPERQTMPNYQIDKIFDRSKLTAWYEIVGFRKPPRFFVDFTQDQPVLESLSNIAISSNVGSTEIVTNPKPYSTGQKITLGDIFASNTEEVTVTGKTATGLRITPAKYAHFSGDSVYPGTGIKQVNGAVALIDFTFPYPEKVNFIRLIPFASQPQKVHGIYTSSSTTKIKWEKIPNSEQTRLLKGKAITFGQRVAMKLRIVLEQPNSEFITRAVPVNQASNDTSWEVIYENEYKKKLPEMERKLERYTVSEIVEANARGERGFLSRRNVLDSIRTRLYNDTNGSTEKEADQELKVLNEFVTGKSTIEELTNVITLRRHVYELGLLEVEMFNNTYRPYSDYEGKIIPPKQTVGTYSLYADQETDDSTTIHHSIVLNTGEEVPIVNQSEVMSSGEIASKNELLDVDPATAVAVLRLRPFKNNIDITLTGPDTEPDTFNVPVAAGGLVTIPAAYYDQKFVYQTTYAVAEPDVDVISNITSEDNTFVNTGTTDGAFLELPSSPYIALGIVNDIINWKKRSRLHGIWDYQLPGYNDAAGNVSWVGSTRAFPMDGLVIDDTYFGRACYDKLFRTPELEAFLYSIMSAHSGDVKLRVERFFEENTGNILEENLKYEPIVVKVNGQTAQNLSNYDGRPDSGFVSELELTQQYRHFSNRLLFPAEVKSVIEVKYRQRAATVQYKGRLLCNRKSRFFTSPMLKSVLLVTAQ